MRICRYERDSRGLERDLLSSTVERACREELKSFAASARSLRCLITVSTDLSRALSWLSKLSR